MSLAILRILDKGVASSGSVLTVLHAVIHAVDNMGGTLGAIFGILLAAFASSLRARRANNQAHLIDVLAPSLVEAVESLQKHTGARIGDRTVMDVLIPFSETLNSGRDLEKAGKSAEMAAEETRNLKPRFGRASYVGADGQEKKVPDPGAWALTAIVRGIYDATL
jgi:dihydroxyacetone kinase